MLRTIKAIHTVIWVIMAAANFAAFYFAFIGRFDAWFWIPTLLIIGESIVIMANGWVCPITPIAERYTEDRRANFDIYLPEWLARYNVRIFTVLIGLEILAASGKNIF